MGKKAREILLLVLVAAVLVFVLVDAGRFFLRVDLTRSRSFTISQVSRSLFRQIPERLHITYYLSDALRSLSPTPGRVIDLLQEYAATSGGKVGITVVDPDKSGQAESARRFGILPQQIQVIQQNEQRVTEVYSGITIEYLDRFSSLPAVFDPDNLEYALGVGIRKVLAGRSTRVGVVVGEPDKSFARDFDGLRSGLSRNFSLREFLPGARIPPDADVLLVFGGTGLSKAQLRPIDEYVRNGGKALFAVKGIRLETAQTFSASAVKKSPILDMLESYGVRVDREMVLDRSCRNYRIPQEVSGQIRWETIGKYPPWVSIRAVNVSQANPITANFLGLDLLWPSPLEAVAREGVSSEPLVLTTTAAWTMREPFVVDPYRVPQAGAEPSSSKNQRVLALALRGSFPPAFAEGAPGKPTRMVVVGDDAFVTDLMQFSDSLYNVLFIENAVLWLSGSADLLTIKARAPSEGKLDRIEDTRRRQRFMLASEIINVCAIPLLVLVFGLVRWLRRRE
jgi:ABC-type uncharacterized transport system involved in gliding motility auxiliary subunit